MVIMWNEISYRDSQMTDRTYCSPGLDQCKVNVFSKMTFWMRLQSNHSSLISTSELPELYILTNSGIDLCKMTAKDKTS